jgi:hypothetical protein
MVGRRLLLLCALVYAGCDDGSNASDMSITCSELCQQFATCYQTANPGFVGSTNALVPCENTCFSLSEDARDQLRTCEATGCGDFLTCAATAGLKLMPKTVPDASVSDLGGDGG